MNNGTPFFSNKVQEVIISPDGVVSQSSDTIFALEIGTNLFKFHPFFESLQNELSQGDKMNLAFPCVQFDQEEESFICDITIKKERDFLAILFFDYSTHYEHLHEAAQEKKTAMLNEQAHNLKKQHSQEKQEYVDFISQRLDSKIINRLEEVVKALEELKKSSLNKDQQSLIQNVEQEIGELHLKAMQIKEGIDFDFD